MNDLRKSIVGILAGTQSSYKFNGTGFLVEGGMIFTCAHVVGKDKAVGQLVFFQFDGNEAVLTAKIEYFKDYLDIAVLRPNSLPDTAIPLQLAESKTSRGHKFSVFGYPQKGEFRGLYGQGNMMGLVIDNKGREVLQFASSQVTYGYSGGPIVDETHKMVIGMVRGGLQDGLSLKDKLGDTAFAIPTEILKVVCPALKIQEASASFQKHFLDRNN